MFYTDAVKAAKAREVDPNAGLEGKTIAKMTVFFSRMFILFTDMTWVSYSAGVEWEQSAYLHRDYEIDAYDLSEAGIISWQELQAENAAEKEAIESSRESQERAQYEKLKAKFGG